MQYPIIHHPCSPLFFIFFLPYRVGDNLRYARHGFGERLRQVQCKQGEFL